MAARKKALKVDAEFDFLALGIVSVLHDYRMCWFLNARLSITLKKAADHTIANMALHKQMNFSHYEYHEELTKSAFHVLENKHTNDLLLPEIKEIDFIMLIHGGYYNNRAEDIVKKIKSIQEVQTAFLLKIEELKSKNNLLLDDTDSLYKNKTR